MAGSSERTVSEWCRWRRRLLRAAGGGVLLAGVGVALLSCALTPPRVGSVDGVSRLNSVDGSWPGLGAAVRIGWDEHLIPSIEAESAADAAYAIGVVHAHLRLVQMELFRKISQGRISEVAGPPTVEIDAAIRAVDLGRAAEAIEAGLDARTREWIEAYVAGINAYRERMDRRPSDARVLGIGLREPWTVRDVLTFGRLASVDVNWGRWITLAGLRDEAGAEDFTARLWRFSDAGVSSFGAGEPHRLDVLTDVGRSGSNAFVVSGSRSSSGGALVASDPHLGLSQPNTWCIVGYRTPGSSVVGLTIPGLPFVLVGRNERVAWTGTNMQGSSSVLYRLPEGWEAESTRTEPIGVRFWFDAERSVRESAFGPVITDAELLSSLDDGDVALRWRGHTASDEFGSFLRASLATDWDGFRGAFSGYAAGGQNLLYGDSAGNIGQLMAIEAVPAAAAASRIGVVDAGDRAYAWSEGVPSDELPTGFNPESGVLVSANNVPTPMEPPLVAQGNANDRVLRMQGLLGQAGPLSLDDLAAVQRDVYSEPSHRVAARLVELGAGVASGSAAAGLRDELAAWDGAYERESRGALVYQVVLAALIDPLYADRYGEGILRVLRSAGYLHDFVREDLAGDGAAGLVALAFESAVDDAPAGKVWGAIHELPLAHPIGLVPVLGRGYVFDRLAYRGSTTVVAKAAHSVTSGKHTPRFGANSRMLIDMGTQDDNRVVLLGGQDGWIGSDRMLDMVPLWSGGRYVPLPLTREGQASRRVRETVLEPGG
ncbi:MAG: penicillin acylase family protein [Planctomycetota bacterium]